MYHFFSKFGYHKRRIEWLPILIARIFLGMFFIISAFNGKERLSLFQRLKDHQIPFPQLNAYLIPGLQLIFAFLILIGLLTTLSSLILLILKGALIMMAENVSTFLCYANIPVFEALFRLPEVLHIVMLFWLLFSGPGKVSVDYRYGKRKREEIFKEE